ncbi:zinc finger MYND domain-containing protein 12 isoform X2 [Rhineura floridana]|uniref:zinc finger MYND domain-containing protein 12 isoform X2 n=1 Tax=Rhineura floridana TaxID=261503 RepID=UPI002AC85BE0|nr:zinc finger MYND domain-containing protein 12 isoform X2 [Rhineura floridana]
MPEGWLNHPSRVSALEGDARSNTPEVPPAALATAVLATRALGEMQTERLVPLALPRGQKRWCELCLGPATLRCGSCGVTYYCDIEHQRADWVSVHEKICQLLIPLRTSLPFYNSEKERKHGEEQKISREKFLAELTHAVAQNFLLEGKHEDAIPAALHSLKFIINVHGSNSVELVPEYLVLAEASLGLGHLSQAEEYLSQAHWIVLKNSHCSSAIQSKLHRNLGLLHAAKGNFEDSLYHLANDVYFACCAFGTNNVAASGGYFHMANVFFRQNRMEVADSLYTEVTDIWHHHFSHLIDLQYYTLMTPVELDMLSEEEEPMEEALDEKQRTEASQMLNAILDIREQSARPQLANIAKILHALAMFHYLILDVPKAHELVTKVRQITKKLPKYVPDESLHRLIRLMKSKPIYAK